VLAPSEDATCAEAGPLSAAIASPVIASTRTTCDMTRKGSRWARGGLGLFWRSNTIEVMMVERLDRPVSDADLRSLAELLIDAVESGAAVSFLAPLTFEGAEDWWRKTFSASHAGAIFLVARDADGIVGTVQLHPAWAPNQPHRAEIVKLLVHRRGRRAGLGTRLMHAIEDAARRSGFRLLTLDAKRGGEAEALYRHLGWVHAGTIPQYALDPDGTNPHDAVIFYKELSSC
jgi:GNAT superfamily N-acetyltransferase